MSFGQTFILTFEVIVLIKVFIIFHTVLGMAKEALYDHYYDRFLCRPFYGNLFRSIIFLSITAIEASFYAANIWLYGDMFFTLVLQLLK